jgi:hypothetical protein
MLKAMFGDQQMETLADIIQTALICCVSTSVRWAERLVRVWGYRQVWSEIPVEMLDDRETAHVSSQADAWA